MRVRAAARLHLADLYRPSGIREVEDADASEALGCSLDGRALEPAVDAAARLLDRHDQEVADDRDVALAAGANDRRQKLRRLTAGQAIDVEAVIAAGDHDVALKGHIRVRERQQRRARVAIATATAARG